MFDCKNTLNFSELSEEWRKIMSPEFVVQCMYAADPFGVIGGEVALAGNNELVAQVLPQTVGISGL